MDVTRRDFFALIAGAGGLAASSARALADVLEPERLLDFESLGNVTLLHMTDPPRDPEPRVLPGSGLANRRGRRGRDGTIPERRGVSRGGRR